MLPMKVWDEEEKRMWFVQSLHIEDEWIRAMMVQFMERKKF